MRSSISSLVAALWVLQALSCGREAVAPGEAVTATTESGTYVQTDTVIVSIMNKSSGSVTVLTCSFTPAYILQRKEEDRWEGVDGTVCVPEAWFWKEMGAEEEWEHLIPLREAPAGTYRLGYTLREIPPAGSEDLHFWTNNFTVVDT